jgi:hypothetical protein
MIVLCVVCPVRADDVWDFGHHDILDGDTYGEIEMSNDATADMWGGDVFELRALDNSRFNMYGGTMDILMVRNNSIANIYSGAISFLDIHSDNDILVNLYAYNVIYHPTEGNNGWMEGNYVRNNQHFAFNIGAPDISHINIVPEPTTILLLSLGSILLRNKR